MDMTPAGVQGRLNVHGDPVKSSDAEIKQLRDDGKPVDEIAAISGRASPW